MSQGCCGSGVCCTEVNSFVELTVDVQHETKILFIGYTVNVNTDEVFAVEPFLATSIERANLHCALAAGIAVDDLDDYDVVVTPIRQVRNRNY